MSDSGTPRKLFAAALWLTAPAASAQDLVSRAIGPDGLQFLILLALVFIVVFVPLYFVGRREKRKYELYTRFIDKGQEIPPELLPMPPSRRSSRERDFIRGVWLGCFGLGLGIVLLIASGDWRVAAWALIPIFLAAASFINANLLKPAPDS